MYLGSQFRDEAKITVKGPVLSTLSEKRRPVPLDKTGPYTLKSYIGTSEKFRRTQARLNPVGRNLSQFRNSNRGDHRQIWTWTNIKVSWSGGRKTGQDGRNFWFMELKIKYIACSFMFGNNDMGSCHMFQFDDTDGAFFTVCYVTRFCSSIP